MTGAEPVAKMIAGKMIAIGRFEHGRMTRKGGY
jgi:hypothetical protein